MMTKSRSATIVERGTNENQFNMATNVLVRAYREQWSVNRDHGGVEAIGNYRLSAFPCGSCALKMKLIAIEKRDPCCRSSC
jgi:hypothetical protein